MGSGGIRPDYRDAAHAQVHMPSSKQEPCNQMDGSALRTVFGSSASLAEISGDSVNSDAPPQGYSRFGLNEHPPQHQMHTKVRRLSTASKGDKSLRPFAKRPYSPCVQTAVLLVFGVLQSMLMHVHVPLAVEPSTRQRVELLFIGSALVVFAGLTVPQSGEDGDEIAGAGPGSRPSSAGAGPGAPGEQDLGETRNWKTDLIRSYGALLGLLYLTEKLPKDGVVAWVIIVPSIWFICDMTLNGLLVGLTVSLIGTMATFYEFPELLHIGGSETLYAAAGTAAAYFGTSLVAGNVGRGLQRP